MEPEEKRLKTSVLFFLHTRSSHTLARLPQTHFSASLFNWLPIKTMESTDGILIKHREIPGNYAPSLSLLLDDQKQLHLFCGFIREELQLQPICLWSQQFLASPCYGSRLGTLASVISMGFSHCLFSPMED